MKLDDPKQAFMKSLTPHNLYERVDALEAPVPQSESTESSANITNNLIGDFGTSSINDSGIHTNANVVDINWWLPLTLESDNATTIRAAVLRTIGGVKYLYVGGTFARIGGVTAGGIARYNFAQRTWEAVGNGLGTSPYVYAIAFDSADNLYVGGTFTDAASNYIAKLSGGAWVNVGGGVNQYVNAIAFDSADNLYIGGEFINVGGDAAADYIAKLSGGAWVNVGGGVNNYVNAIAFDSADNLYVGGTFTNASGDAGADYIAKLSGGAWVNVGGGVNGYVYALAFDSADNLYIGGGFTDAGGDAGADRIAKLVGGAWVNVGGGVNGYVYALAFDSADNLYIGGAFTDAFDIPEADRIAKWDGAQWSALSNGGGLSGLGGYVYAIAVDNDTGNVYAGGSFDTAGTIQTKSIAVFTKPLSEAIDLLANMPEVLSAKIEAEIAAHIANTHTQICDIYDSGASQSIPNATATVITFNSEREDTNGMHDITTNNSRVIIKTAGTYIIFGQIRFAGNATGFREAEIYMNTSTIVGIGSQINAGIVSPVTCAATAVGVYAINDFFELKAYQTSGGALNAITGNLIYGTKLTAIRIG